MGFSSIHLNNNLLCAVDVETTGLDPEKHEIVQLALVPLAPDLTVSKHFGGPFEIRIRPENVDYIDSSFVGLNRPLIQDAITHGLEHWSAVDFFRSWFEKKLKLAYRKRIVPLGCNYESFDYLFLVQFFGGIEQYNEFFRNDVRDVQTAALFLNDLADWMCERIPFPKVSLEYLCSSLQYKNENPHNAIFDALTTAEVYRRMMGKGQMYRSIRTSSFDLKYDELGEAYGKFTAKAIEQNLPRMSFKEFRATWERSFGVVA